MWGSKRLGRCRNRCRSGGLRRGLRDTCETPSDTCERGAFAAIYSFFRMCETPARHLRETPARHLRTASSMSRRCLARAALRPLSYWRTSAGARHLRDTSRLASAESAADLGVALRFLSDQFWGRQLHPEARGIPMVSMLRPRQARAQAGGIPRVSRLGLRHTHAQARG